MASYSYTTKLLSVNAAKAFLQKSTMVTGSANDQDTETEKRSQILYLCIGNTKEWPNDEPINPPDNVQNLRYDTYRNFVGCVKVQPSSMCHVTDRYDWVSGTVYAMWRDTDIDMYEKNFYVLTSEYNVYKCLYNNHDSASVVEPKGFSTIPFTTSDGYTWKYMYTVSLGDANKFLTQKYMPVRTIQENSLEVCGCSIQEHVTQAACEAAGGIWTCTAESDKQLRIQNAAIDGALHVAEVNLGGERYTYTSDSDGLVSAATSTTLTLSNAVQNKPSTENNYYNKSSIYVISGTGAGQIRRVIDYVASTRTLTVHKEWDTIPDLDSRVVISPTVTIVGDGQGATAYSRVNASGEVSNVNIVTVGSGYTKAQIYFSANTSSSGTGASANVMISPVHGHGFDPIEELYADKIMIDVELEGVVGSSSTGAGYIPTNNIDNITGESHQLTYRSISLLADPILKVDENNEEIETAVVAKSFNSPNSLRTTTRLNVAYDDQTAEEDYLNINEIITTKLAIDRAKYGRLEFVTELDPTELVKTEVALANAVQAANGHVVYIEDDTTATGSIYNIYINNVESYGNEDPFTQESVLNRSTVESDLAVVESIKQPELQLFSGDILFTENIDSVVRDSEQTENIKIVLDF